MGPGALGGRGMGGKVGSAPSCYGLRQHSEFEFRHPSKTINGRHKHCKEEKKVFPLYQFS
jgi:hypothetical protein